MQQARIDLGSKHRLRRVGFFFGLGSVLCRELQVQRFSPVGFRFGILSLETAREWRGEAALAHPKGKHRRNAIWKDEIEIVGLRWPQDL